MPLSCCLTLYLSGFLAVRASFDSMGGVCPVLLPGGEARESAPGRSFAPFLDFSGHHDDDAVLVVLDYFRPFSNLSPR